MSGSSICTKISGHRYHTLELHSDGIYYCDCGLVSKTHVDGHGSVDGTYCTVCGTSLARDQERPCDCAVPEVFGTAARADWRVGVTYVGQPPDHAD